MSRVGPTKEHDYNLQDRELEAQEHRQNRETLFSNEKFIIGILQAINGAIIGGIVSQFDKFEKIIGVTHVKALITLSTISLIFAIISAFFKHEYKKWDLNGQVASNNEEFKLRSTKANRYLNQMRFSITTSTAVLCFGLLLFISNLWNL